MKKKLALIIISMDECFPQGGFSGGGHKVTKNLIQELISSEKFIIDIFCKKGSPQMIEGINSVTILKDFKEISDKNYDYILSSDVLLPFANNVIHSNSSPYKSKNGKNAFQQLILKIFNAKKIARQKENMSYNKAVFAVSESLRQDYIENFGLDEAKVFTCHPAVDEETSFSAPVQKEFLTIGSMVGGGLNKGGYLLLLALKMLPKNSKIRAKVIFPKIKKSGIFQATVKLLRLSDKIEILSKQSDMGEYYKSIDCYVLPSLNEAFGLVVTEAASNSKPSLVSSTTGVRELVEDNFDGFVFDREKNPAKNLSDKLNQIEKIYFDEFDKFIQIAQKAHEIPQKLSWKEFVNIIIENMVEENEH